MGAVIEWWRAEQASTAAGCLVAHPHRAAVSATPDLLYPSHAHTHQPTHADRLHSASAVLWRGDRAYLLWPWPWPRGCVHVYGGGLHGRGGSVMTTPLAFVIVVMHRSCSKPRPSRDPGSAKGQHAAPCVLPTRALGANGGWRVDSLSGVVAPSSETGRARAAKACAVGRHSAKIKVK